MTNENLDIRPSPIAGTWYPSDPKKLAETVDAYIEDAVVPDLPGKIIALVAPHAGYRYSGAVAGHAFKTIKGKSFDEVIVISPMHQYYPQPLVTSAHEAYRTPLGDIPLAIETLSEINLGLKDNLGMTMAPVRNDQEHSLEIELPFLQRALTNDFRLIPIMLREQNRQLSKVLGDILSEVIKDKSCLLVASSDLSHFYHESKANQLDQNVLTELADFSPEGLFEIYERGKGQACGLAAIATILWASRALGAKEVTILSYDTSGSSTGDHSSVVGYGAAAVTRPQ
jgi:AmmeMemoRadiSam system protein B